jgi:hypothetical protein
MAFWCAGRTPSLPGAGETSSMNAMVWVRGSRRDYDGQAMPGWGSYMTHSVSTYTMASPCSVRRSPQCRFSASHVGADM